MIVKTQSNTNDTADAINGLVNIIHQISELSQTITTAINQQADATREVSELLMQAAEGSKDITQAISDVASLGEDLEY